METFIPSCPQGCEPGLYGFGVPDNTKVMRWFCMKCGTSFNAPKMTPARDSILAEAEQATTKTRRDEYGHPFDNFTQIAAEWSLELGVPVTAEQVGRMMIRLKMVRLRHNPNHRDSLLDIAGYANCLEMIRERRSKPCT